MPKSLKEIKHFHSGTVINSSEQDISDDTAAFSLNIDPISEGGILSSINNDRISLSTDNTLSRCLFPVTWGSDNQFSATDTGYNTSSVIVPDISVFSDKDDIKDVNVIGTKGRLERLKVNGISPWWEQIKLSSTQGMTWRAGYGSAVISGTEDSLTYLSDTNAITDSTILNFTTSGFTAGSASIAISGSIASGGTFTILTPDGKEVTYEFDTSGSPATGAVISSTKCCVQLSGAGTNSAKALQIKAAIENPTNGHDDRITITESSGTLSLTYNQQTMDNYLSVGDYFTLQGAGSFNASNQEIIKIVSQDTVNRKFYIKRNVLGSLATGYLGTYDYKLWSNKLTIDGRQISTNRAVLSLGGWSKYSANNIGGTGLWINKADDDTNKSRLGKIISSAKNVAFSASAKTITLSSMTGGIVKINEGDIVTFYYGADGEDEPNNGKSFTVLRKEISGTTITLHVDTAPSEDNPESSDIVYFETGLIKNNTFHHSSDEINPTVEVGSSQIYKVNNWSTKRYSYSDTAGGEPATMNNSYTTSTTTLVSRENTGGYWEDTTADHGADNAENYYPFNANDAYISIEAEYKDTTVNIKSSCSATDEFIFAGDKSVLAVNDIVKIENEYMRILSMTQNKLFVQRGILGTDAVGHSTVDIYKSINPSISQSISKDYLKTGQPYILTFYAKDLYVSIDGSNVKGYGAISVRFNGGYVDASGNWNEALKDNSLGYIQTPSKITQEKRWIDFSDLEKVNGDLSFNADNSESDSNLDTTWRRFQFLIYPPQGVEFLTDMEIEITSRGKDGTKIGIDLIDLSELTYLSPVSNNSEVTSVGSIDNSGQKDLVLYDSKSESLKVVENFQEEANELSNVKDVIEKSPFASEQLKSNSKTASFVSKNRETHIGFGSKAEDSKPQWLGYLNSKIFGVDSNNTLYQDEDTVHSYNDSGLITMSKVTLAGEHENLDVATFSAPNLRINHTAHKMQNGNNIIVREYQDIDNSWDGNGVWVVTDASNADYFLCQRIDAKDADPSGQPAGNKISYRPYYYYGIKDGDNHLYRIVPDDIYTSSSAVSAEYIKGKIEKSLPLPYRISSITTCYNKDTSNGVGGGRVYILTDNGELKVLNLELGYNEWSKVNISEVSSLTLNYKSYKWSNDHISGDINGNTAVYNSLASESTPTIIPSGIISDILETKSPNADFVHASTSTNDLDHFDTRLWVQFRPASGESFSSGSRFLFCGLTNSTLTDSDNNLFLGDRTPPTNIVLGKKARWDSSENFFSAGPGLFDGEGGYDENIGDMPVNKIQHHALFGWGRSSQGGNSDKQRLNQMGVKTSLGVNDIEYYDLLDSWNDDGEWFYTRTPEVNFGNNVGWNGAGGLFPSIKVAKYGLFPMGDNNCDGVIDGTGLVVPGNFSIDDTINNQGVGPYGWEHEQVCGHAVGIIGGSESPWTRDFGSLNGHNPTSTSNVNYYRGSEGGAPENMSLEKCVFICSDVHYGDKPFPHTTSGIASTAFTAVEWVSGDADSATLVTVASTVGLKPGDTVYITSSNNTDGAYTVLKINSTTTFTVNMNHDADEAGVIYPHTIRPFNPGVVIPNSYSYSADASLYSVQGNYQHYHWAYKKDNPLDGDIFTNGSEGGGHYSKTWWNPTDSFGLSTTSVNYDKPGLLHRVERLNYRAGYMIKPFDLDSNTFEDLVIGNTVSIDAPVRPEAIYHTETGGKTHDNQGGNDNNQFATKIFITSQLEDTYDETGKSKIYICDPTFEYPDILHQIEIERSQGTGSTNTWNGEFKSYEPILYGKIKAHSNTPDATKPAQIGANIFPYISIEPSEAIDTHSLLSASSVWRESNRFAGNMLSIIDQTTGAIQTRYIVSSDTEGDGTDANHDLYLAVHFPFGATPADDDLFYIWSHKNACTSSMRLFKEKELDFSFLNDGTPTTVFKADPVIGNPIYKTKGDMASIDGDTTTLTITTDVNHNLSTNDVIEVSETTNYNDLGPLSITVTDVKTFTASVNANYAAENNVGIWTLVDSNRSDSGVSNPAKISLDSGLNKTLYGGLDMRKLRGASITAIADNTDDITLTASANHFFDVGDTITFNSTTDTQDGVYEITADNGTTTFDITNSVHTDDSGTWPATTSQWESITLAGASAGKIGKIRAGLNKWDTGSVTGNLLRKDNDTVSDSSLYLGSTDASLIITTPSIGDETNDYFLKNTEYEYKASLIYDGYQEGPLSTSTWSFKDTQKTRQRLNIDLSIKKYSKRLTHVCLYRRDSKDSFYRLVKEIPTSGGWNNDGTVYKTKVIDSGATEASYESRTGRSEVLYDIDLKYGISAEIDGYLFAGDCSHSLIKNASNQIFRSKPGMYSVFDFSVDFLQLKSKPTALANFAGRLFAFDNSNIYKINQENLVIEDIYEGIGCLGKDSVIVTEYGMFFADKNGAYMHNGTSPTKISTQIEKGGSSSETWGGTDNINNISWETLAGTSISSKPYVVFDSKMVSVLFFANYSDYDSTNEQSIKKNYCWSYNLIKQRWDLWEVSNDTFVGTPFIGDKSSIFVPIDNAIYKYKGGSTKRDYTWLSKKLTMEEDSIVKVYNKVKLNGLTSNLNLGGDNKESSDRLLIKTSTGDVSSPTHSESDNQNSQYKLSGSNKKGRWLQFKLEDMTSPIESVGIIYRRKSTK